MFQYVPHTVPPLAFNKFRLELHINVDREHGSSAEAGRDIVLSNLCDSNLITRIRDVPLHPQAISSRFGN